MNNFQYETGVIHGRFQILHNDHLKYLWAGKELCKHLVVGITNPDPTLSGNEATDPQRSAQWANPLNFFERYQLVKKVLEDNGLDQWEYSIVPMPINYPDLYKYYLPLDAVFFLTIYDDWGRKKREFFRELGLHIHVLWELSAHEKGISASRVRQNMLNREPWEHLVPGVVAEQLQIWNIASRLQQLVQDSTTKKV